VHHQEQETSDQLDELERVLPVMDAIAITQQHAQEVLAVAFDAEDQADAVRRLRRRFGWDDLQAHAALDVTFRYATRDKRSRIAQEIEVMREHVAQLRSEAAAAAAADG
jgi:DNA gyrase/topoisomerase IV subunit A